MGLTLSSEIGDARGRRYHAGFVSAVFKAFASSLPALVSQHPSHKATSVKSCSTKIFPSTSEWVRSQALINQAAYTV